MIKEDADKEKHLIEPFGDTDASRARSVESIDKVGSEGFVKIIVSSQGGISNGGEDRYRVIVGKKGSGKTLYLRRLSIKIEEDSSYSEDIIKVIEYLIQTSVTSLLY